MRRAAAVEWSSIGMTTKPKQVTYRSTDRSHARKRLAMISGPERWCVGHTLARKELMAAENLERQGFEVFLPFVMSTRRHARKVEYVKAPLFPRYLFLRIDPARQRWRSVNGTKGVAYLLTNNEAPCPVPPRLVEDLRASVGADGCVASAPRWRPGDQVRIRSGFFSGQVGELLCLTSRERVELLLSLLGSAVRVTLAEDLLELAV